MPSAARPFTAEVVTRLVARGVTIAPLTLHTGVSSLEGDEDPYPEPYDVPPATARLVNLTRQHGGRVIAARHHGGAGAGDRGRAQAGGGRRPLVRAGWTSHVVDPGAPAAGVDGLITGLHEPRSSHLRMLAAFAGPTCSAAATRPRSTRATSGTNSATCTCCCPDRAGPGPRAPGSAGG